MRSRALLRDDRLTTMAWNAERRATISAGGIVCPVPHNRLAYTTVCISQAGPPDRTPHRPLFPYAPSAVMDMFFKRG